MSITASESDHRFSFPNYDHQRLIPRMKKRNPTIHDFPNEVLIMIFKRLYKLYHKKSMYYRFIESFSNAKREESDMDSFSHSPVLDPHEDLEGHPFDPTMFPFAQAKVCRRWRTLLELDPIFWTRIPITVNSAELPLPTSVRYFQLSNNLPTQVYVKRHPDDHRVHDPDEKSYVAVLLPYVSQNVHGIKDIEFSLLHRTSIPDLHHLLVGQANILQSVLSHQEQRAILADVPLDAGDVNHHLGGQMELHFSATKLESLTINSRILFRACASSPTCLANAPDLRHLYTTSAGYLPLAEPLYIGATITALSHASELSCLSFHGAGLHFLEDFASFQPPPLLPNLSEMELTGLTGTAAATFISSGDGACATLSTFNCATFGMDPLTTLALESLDEGCDLTILLRNLTTREIFCENCPAFNDTVLDFMTDRRSNGDDFPVKGMPTLSIMGCTNFHVESLHHIVLARRNAMEANPDWDGTVGGLMSIDSDDLSAITCLSVEREPFLSEEYRRKFEALVPSFYWINAENEG